jgi:hypothetical protein
VVAPISECRALEVYFVGKWLPEAFNDVCQKIHTSGSIGVILGENEYKNSESKKRLELLCRNNELRARFLSSYRPMYLLGHWKAQSPLQFPPEYGNTYIGKENISISFLWSIFMYCFYEVMSTSGKLGTAVIEKAQNLIKTTVIMTVNQLLVVPIRPLYQPG